MAENNNNIIEEINKTVKSLREELDKKSINQESVKKMEDRIAELEAKSQRPNFLAGGQVDNNDIEVKKLFREFATKGNANTVEQLREMAREKKGMSTDSLPDGGIFVPENLATNIVERITEISPIRKLANIVTIGEGNSFKVPIEKSDMEAGWVGEREDRPATETVKFGTVDIILHEMYAKPKVTQRLLDDAAFNFESYYARKVADRFAYLEGQAFINGTGVNMPSGILNNKEIEVIEGKLTTDSLIDLLYSLKGAYANGATWVLKRSTVKELRKLKNDNGDYIWEEKVQEGQPNRLFGLQVEIAEDMPVAGVGNMPIALGNFREGYTIVDKNKSTVIRDPFSAKPWIEFYTQRYVGGAVVNPDAIKILKQSK